MQFESSLAIVLTSLVVFAVGSTDEDDKNRRILADDGEIQHLKRYSDKRNWNGNTTEKRSKRSLSDSERDTVLSNFNSQRSSVGASDMNYVGYDYDLEATLDVWTRGCNYDASNINFFKYHTAVYPDHEKKIRNVFDDEIFFYYVRSVYVTGVAVSVTHCLSFTLDGKKYANAYLSAYGFSGKNAIDNVQRYAIGPACTRCQPSVAWCYNKTLCRADCSFSISECCQISNGRQTSVCAPNVNSGRSGAPGIQAIGTTILHGFLLFICYYFQ